MRLVFRLGGDSCPVDLAQDPGGIWRVTAGGRDLAAGLDLGGTDLARDVRNVIVELDGRPVRAVVARDGARWWVALGGELAVFEEGTDDQQGSSSAHGPLDVVSPIPGRVLEVLVKPGDEVELDQVVVSVEAMKMEHGLKAERAGRVARVLVAPGDRVEPGQLLAQLEP